MLRIPHFLDNRLTDGGKVPRPVGLTNFAMDEVTAGTKDLRGTQCSLLN
jgi:hypothetical protein